jgi:phospholipase C
LPDDQALERLDKIEHIVVLMMENRSFDQMLGYLELDGMNVEGLKGAKPNPDDGGQPQEVFEWGEHQTAFHPKVDPSGKILDPCHGPECVAEQLEDDNTGFVRNFVTTRPTKDQDDKPIKFPEEFRNFPMGYYSSKHLPVYDHLARTYCVCDHWHSAIPGDTWPNRCWALAADTSETVGHKSGLLDFFKEIGIVEKLQSVPLFEVEAFTRHLEEGDWRWYSHDPGTLRAADAEYRELFDTHRGNFAYFDRRKVSFFTEKAEGLITTGVSFLDDAANGKLRPVSWIDPNFIDLSVLDPNSDDDHPPSDVFAGQRLVFDLYEALVSSPNWENTMLVITYDEHGGFYDHVAPPETEDGSGHETYGVRVPALVVGPRVQRAPCHELFDHTSLIKTILTRFGREGSIEAMSENVKHDRIRKANHLGVALADRPSTHRPTRKELKALRSTLTAWQQRAKDARRAEDQKPSPLAGDGAGQRQLPTEFQDEFAGFALAVRRLGLPAGQP